MSDAPTLAVVTGASGLIGRALCAELRTRGTAVRRLVRRVPKEPDEFAWDPTRGELESKALDGCDVIFHLAGEGVGDGRWSAARKRRIEESRVIGTRLLADRVIASGARPQAFVQASAIGYYGDTGSGWCDESSPAGPGFLAAVTERWEAASAGVPEAGIRSCYARFGVVLSREGGALKRMLLPFKLGLGGRIGSGEQYLSWIALDDAVAALLHLASPAGPPGPVNVVAPEPVTNAVFTRALGRVLGRPALIPVPGRLLKLVLGEMAEELLLASARVSSEKLRASGFRFGRTELESALR